MRKFLLSAFIIGTGLVKAQTVANDWTLTDCSTSTTYNLFSMLDNEEVVVMEFAMGCGTCTNAAGYLMDLKNDYDISHPGKVKFFYMDYWTGNDCATDVVPVVAPYAFTAAFEHCSPEKSYYMSGSPMPAIVIVGGSNHLVLSEKNSWSNSDTASIKATIDNFFATVGQNEVAVSDKISFVYPNPGNGQFNLMVEWSANEPADISITDLTGKVVHTLINQNLVEGTQQLAINASFLSEGNYSVTIRSATGMKNLLLIIKK